MKKLEAKIWKGKEYYYCENEELNIHELGYTVMEAYENFYNAFLRQKEHYKNLPEWRSLGLALKIKKAFAEILEDE